MKPKNQPHKENGNQHANKLQMLIDKEIRILNDSLNYTYEPYMLESEQFKAAVAKARSQLNINGTPNIPEEEIWKWAKLHIIHSTHKTVSYRNHLESAQIFREVVQEALLESGLPDDLQGLLTHYIVNLTPPTAYPVNSFHPVKIINVEDDGIVLKIDKGLRYDEFINMWKPLATHLGKGRRKSKNRPNKFRDMQIYDKKLSFGLSNRELAKQYIGGEEEYDIDTIKKIIKRQKRRLDEGTDLTK